MFGERDSSGKGWKLALLAGGLLVATVVLLGACAPGTDGGDGGLYSGGEPAEPADEGDGSQVTMEGTTFRPGEITVAPGTTVTWVNGSGLEHTVTAGTRGNPTGMFDETVAAGDSFSFTFQEPGTYDYFCSFHPGMSGVVIVGE